jgi:hypothetical protein
MVLASLLPWWSTVQPSPGTTQRVFSIGVPVGPWFRHIKQEKANPDGTTEYSTFQEYMFGPASAFPLLIGVGLLIASRKGASPS